MSVPELAIQIRNSPGEMAQVTAVLAEANANILGITASSAGKHGWVRVVIEDAKAAQEALEDCGYEVESGEAVAVSIADEPGTIDHVLRILADAKINVDYIYTVNGRSLGTQILILGIQTPGKAERLLTEAGQKITQF